MKVPAPNFIILDRLGYIYYSGSSLGWGTNERVKGDKKVGSRKPHSTIPGPCSNINSTLGRVHKCRSKNE